MKKSQEALSCAANNAVKTIADAAAEAVKAIASASAEAAKVVASTAAAAAKVVETKNSGDHDLLVELKTKMDDLKEDIAELKDGTSERINSLENEKLNTKDSYPVLYRAAVEATLKDHEDRIRINTVKIVQIMTWGSAAILAIGVAEFLLNRFMK